MFPVSEISDYLLQKAQSNRIAQIFWVRLLSWKRKCEVYFSQRRHWIFIFHTCGNYEVKSRKWGLVSYLKNG